MTKLEASQIQSLAEAIWSVKISLNQFVSSNYVTDGYVDAHGVAIWLPSDVATLTQFMDSYQNLEFSKITQWGLALASLFK